MAARPDVVALLTDFEVEGTGSEQRFVHRDGRPFTEAETELVSSATEEDMRAAANELAAAPQRLAELLMPYIQTVAEQVSENPPPTPGSPAPDGGQPAPDGGLFRRLIRRHSRLPRQGRDPAAPSGPAAAAAVDQPAGLGGDRRGHRRAAPGARRHARGPRLRPRRLRSGDRRPHRGPADRDRLLRRGGAPGPRERRAAGRHRGVSRR